MAKASETRAPVWTSVRAKVWSWGRSAKRAASRKRRRSSAARYLRLRTRRDISLCVVFASAVPKGPAQASQNCETGAIARVQGFAAGRK